MAVGEELPDFGTGGAVVVVERVEGGEHGAEGIHERVDGYKVHAAGVFASTPVKACKAVGKRIVGNQERAVENPYRRGEILGREIARSIW